MDGLNLIHKQIFCLVDQWMHGVGRWWIDETNCHLYSTLTH